MSLYPEFPQGVLSPGYMDLPRNVDPGPMAMPSINVPMPNVADSAQIAAATGRGKPLTEPQEADRPGFFGRIRQQPGGSRALIALGASLLSNPNFFEGLGNGAMAYQGVLDEEAQRLQPQLTRDGQFAYQRDPNTGEIRMTRTAAGDFEEQMATNRLQNSYLIAGLREQGDTDRLRTTMGFRDDWERMGDTTRNRELDMRDGMNIRDNETDLEIARINAENSWQEAQLRVGNNANNPPPASIQRQISDYTSTRDAQNNAAAQLDPIIRAIEGGQLSFSLPSNMRHRAAIATGIGGNEETVWFSQYQTSLESLRNALLVANKGVQTDGDAERAMAELIAGSGNTDTVLANLRRVYASLGTRAQQAEARIDELARQYGADVSSSSPNVSNSRNTRSTGSSNGVRWRIVN